VGRSSCRSSSKRAESTCTSTCSSSDDEGASKELKTTGTYPLNTTDFIPSNKVDVDKALLEKVKSEEVKAEMKRAKEAREAKKNEASREGVQKQIEEANLFEAILPIKHASLKGTYMAKVQREWAEAAAEAPAKEPRAAPAPAPAAVAMKVLRRDTRPPAPALSTPPTSSRATKSTWIRPACWRRWRARGRGGEGGEEEVGGHLDGKSGSAGC
jgi:hypothetical protein